MYTDARTSSLHKGTQPLDDSNIRPRIAFFEWFSGAEHLEIPRGFSRSSVESPTPFEGSRPGHGPCAAEAGRAEEGNGPLALIPGGVTGTGVGEDDWHRALSVS